MKVVNPFTALQISPSSATPDAIEPASQNQRAKRFPLYPVYAM
jgi:hypothetical protein